MSWSQLPLEPLMYTFSFLSPACLCVVAQVCQSWKQDSEREEVWRRICRAVRITIKDESNPSKEVYRNWFLRFGECAEVYPILADLLERFKAWQKANGFSVTLSDGTSKETLEKAAKRISEVSGAFEWPNELKCWYLLTNGQPAQSPGFFGGYSFYNVTVDMSLLSVEQIVQFAVSKPTLSRNFLPIATAPGYQKVYFISRNQDQNSTEFQVRNQIVCFGEVTLFPIAENFIALVHDHIVNLESKNFIIREGQINLFPQNNIPTAETNHVRIKASPMFIPERSSPTRFFWAYSIIMEMDNDVPHTCDCQLTRRHWDITSGNQTEVVDGDGVIGLYPKMFPGAHFVYESCCPLDTKSGIMGGYFTMRKTTGGTFNAIVPTFELKIPKLLRDPRKTQKEKENEGPEKDTEDEEETMDTTDEPAE